MDIPQQLNPIKQYIEVPDNFMINYVKHEIDRLTLDKFLDISIKALDARKVWDNGMRPVQTISYIYTRAITEFVYTVLTYVDSIDRSKWFDKLLVVHVANIEYEKINPPIDYDADKHKNKVKSVVTKQSTPRRKKEDKPSAAEIKLANKVAKLNLLKFNIK
jgi:hypothetical protein